jgi:hypothetical protein
MGDDIESRALQPMREQQLGFQLGGFDACVAKSDNGRC